ncbi:MAG: tetratricopeptide repeat protein [Candidatus Omnitrophica bacterium]|nr:tetratricopeptide repeat protein [Candidatus Omnitrophota bacterium]MCA9424857.1 tetratricopeptide repeat protein [Candidatus Omnitrophota bacterium]MCA9436207.1 tetratricopeptide repeat protein [Candidatus Omnitrophota bacterium]MCA9444988.1 tetratricopeptide repeat protein [Candidatus Omnitrophota bacterium]MCB9768299.1 tetratricopeptide repeat protein [Candidatus Omnitrophota bacterium]
MNRKNQQVEELLSHVRTLGRQGEIMEAGRLLRKMVKDHPDHPEIPFLLGVCYSQIERGDLARVWWKKALELNPQHIRAYAYLKKMEEADPTLIEIKEEGSGAIAGDLENCWDPTK